MVVAVYLQPLIPASLVLVMGTARNSRVLDVRTICNTLSRDTCQALPGLHAFTGCDSVSAFAGRGKMLALELVQKEPSLAQLMQDLGTCFPPRPDTTTSLEKFVCRLYKCSTDDIDEARYDVFCKLTIVQVNIASCTVLHSCSQ